MVFDSIRRALAGDSGEERARERADELAQVRVDLKARLDQLEEKRRSRLLALFPEGPVPGAGPGRFPGLDPVNFEEAEPQPWLVSAATGIIDNFPGGEALLGQLDATFHAFSEANHYRVVEGGPYERLLTWRREVFHAWDLDLDVPVYVSNGGGDRVLGCKRPLVVIDRFSLDGASESEQRFVLAASLGHVFFGNLRIFSFYRLMEMLDKLPSMTGLITRGLGMLPGVGNTISRGIELARSLNQQVIRKTHLVVGQRQHVLTDRLATLALGSSEPAQRVFAGQALGGEAVGHPALRARLIAQGQDVVERFERGEIDLTMLSIVGPNAPFAALRAYKLDQWSRDEASQKLLQGYYVTRERLAEYRRSNEALEEEIHYLEERVLELHRREEKLLGEAGPAEGEASS